MTHRLRGIGIVGVALLLSACGSKERPPQTATGTPNEVEGETSGAEERAVAEAGSAEGEPAAPTDAGIVVIAPGASSGLVEFANAIPLGGTVWVGPLAGNGGREAMIYVPPTPGPPGAELRLVYHFHGTYSERVEVKQEGMKKSRWVGWDRLQQTVDAIAQLAEERPYDVVLVYPLSAGKRIEPDAGPHQQNRAYDRMWMVSDPEHGVRDGFDRLHAEVLDRLEALEINTGRLSSKVIVEGHSAGGIALRNIAQSGSGIPTDYLFLDASFQGWADGCLAALKKSGAEAKITIVMTNNGIADPYGKRDPWCTQMPLDAAAWREHRTWCAGKDDGKPRDGQKPEGAKKMCAALAEAAQLWPESEAWCADYLDDLEHTPGVTLHRTAVYHGDQPRRFAGGLELPAALDVGR